MAATKRALTPEQRRFVQQRKSAKRRKIPFLLTFTEWWGIWAESGKWDQRGKYHGQYCMSRYGDKGAYEIGNVCIRLIEDNSAERNRNYPLLGERNPSYGKKYSLLWTPEQRARHLAACKKPKSLTMRAKLTATLTGSRFVMRDGQRIRVYPGDIDYLMAN